MTTFETSVCTAPERVIFVAVASTTVQPFGNSKVI